MHKKGLKILTNHIFDTSLVDIEQILRKLMMFEYFKRFVTGAVVLNIYEVLSISKYLNNFFFSDTKRCDFQAKPICVQRRNYLLNYRKKKILLHQLFRFSIYN